MKHDILTSIKRAGAVGGVWRRIRSQSWCNGALGIFAIFGGLVLSYISIISPLLGARNHAKEISTYVEVIIITPFLLALGIAHTIFGEKAAKIFGLRTTRPTALGWIFSLIFIAIGIGLYVWFKNTLKGMGYA